MLAPWHERNAEEYARQRAQVRQAYPQLHFFAGPNVTIRGGFPVMLAGRVLDRFQVEISLSVRHPANVPTVREVGKRIPRDSDRHISPNGEACLFLPEEASVHFPPGSTLLDFLQGPVNAFFVSQLHFEEFGAWPFGEWRHGADGTFDYYAAKVGTTDRAVVVRFVDYVQRKEVKGHWECPCGSGEKLRKCHGEKVAELRAQISRTVAVRSFELLGGSLL